MLKKYFFNYYLVKVDAHEETQANFIRIRHTAAICFINKPSKYF